MSFVHLSEYLVEKPACSAERCPWEGNDNVSDYVAVGTYLLEDMESQKKCGEIILFEVFRHSSPTVFHADRSLSSERDGQRLDPVHVQDSAAVFDLKWLPGKRRIILGAASSDGYISILEAKGLDRDDSEGPSLAPVCRAPIGEDLMALSLDWARVSESFENTVAASSSSGDLSLLQVPSLRSRRRLALRSSPTPSAVGSSERRP